MTLTQLQYFIEIARTGNFTIAAGNLYVAQSSLSYAIKELEAELEVPLFVRRPNKRIELSMYGEALLPYAEEGLRIIEDGKNHVVGMKSPLLGKVRIAFFHSIVFTAIPDLLARFREDNPQSKIEFETLVYHNWTDFRQLLLDGKCDLVVSAGNIENGCESRQIAEHQIFMLVPHGHMLASRESAEPSMLRDESLIQIDSGSNMDRRIKEMLSDAGIEPDVRYVSDWTAQQLAVINGKGIALSCDVASDERFVHKVAIDSEYARLPLYLSWAARQKLSGAALYVRDYFLRLSESEGETLLF